MRRFAARHASVVLDLSKDDPPTLRAKARAALSGSASPHFYVAGFGFRAGLRAALGAAGAFPQTFSWSARSLPLQA